MCTIWQSLLVLLVFTSTHYYSLVNYSTNQIMVSTLQFKRDVYNIFTYPGITCMPRCTIVLVIIISSIIYCSQLKHFLCINWWWWQWWWWWWWCPGVGLENGLTGQQQLLLMTELWCRMTGGTSTAPNSLQTKLFCILYFSQLHPNEKSLLCILSMMPFYFLWEKESNTPTCILQYV